MEAEMQSSVLEDVMVEVVGDGDEEGVVLSLKDDGWAGRLVLARICLVDHHRRHVPFLVRESWGWRWRRRIGGAW